jgi:hypothetical protein
MMTFREYLEGMKTFNTRDAGYELPLAADLSDDHNDASFFLLPMARKIKAFGHYLKMAVQDLLHPGTPPWRDFGADKKRITTLQRALGDPNHASFSTELTSLLSYAAQLCREFTFHVEMNSKSGKQGKTYSIYLDQISKYLGKIKNYKYDHDEGDPLEAIIGKIKERAQRMKVFVDEAIKQVPRVKGMELPRKQIVPYDGRGS